jgi:hypothetical protein
MLFFFKRLSAIIYRLSGIIFPGPNTWSYPKKQDSIKELNSTEPLSHTNRRPDLKPTESAVLDHFLGREGNIFVIRYFLAKILSTAITAPGIIRPAATVSSSDNCPTPSV